MARAYGAALHTGPRGGKFYYSASGEKVYGTPPTVGNYEIHEGGKITYVEQGSARHKQELAATGGGKAAASVPPPAPKPVPPKPNPPKPAAEKPKTVSPEPVRPSPSKPASLPPPKPQPVQEKAVEKPAAPKVEAPKHAITPTNASVMKTGLDPTWPENDKHWYAKLQKELADSGDSKKHRTVEGYVLSRYTGGKPAKTVGSIGQTDVQTLGGTPEGHKRQLAIAQNAVARGGFKALLDKRPISIVYGDHADYRGPEGLATGFGSSEGKMGMYERLARAVFLKNASAERQKIENDNARDFKASPYRVKMFGDWRGRLAVVAEHPAHGAAIAAECLLSHELAHHFHFHIEASNKEDHARIITMAAQRFSTGKGVVTTYAGASPHEWFAETHTAYVYYPKELKAKDPEAFDLMREMRKKHGLEE